MNKTILMLVLILFLSNASAIIINEVEMNPVDGASGTEWIELYNDGGGMDISLWELYDGVIGQKKIFTIPSGVILEEEDFYVAELSKAVLNNDGDFVSLYDSGGEEIDKTQMFKETKWGSKTWQLCDDWELLESTKGEENDCVEEESDSEFRDMIPEDLNESQVDEASKVVSSTETGGEDPINNVIDLTPKDIKTSEDVDNSSKTYPIYGFVFLCILLIVLYLTKFRKHKNEFE